MPTSVVTMEVSVKVSKRLKVGPKSRFPSKDPAVAVQSIMLFTFQRK